MKLPPVKKDAGFYLRIFRARYDLTRRQAAKLFKVSPSHWSLIEDGKRHPNPTLAFQLAKVAEAPVQVLLGVEAEE